MNGEGEKTCPLCAEEMDLTDQHLKPCKCGYQICVWCWHHIIEMAEKDETEGRCPACRKPYDKEKIVGMAAKCERLAAEVNLERKKSQKAKPKHSEGRKQLNSVRVIQRNLVYIVGLPHDLADEDLLQHKEYFGQYGKVLKVSMSRTAAGVVQQFPNNTCSVYITYSKEEEAIRCIQAVHGFMLDGRSLKACFGTTKYCHAWLRNVPCTNPDCLYLHEIGSQEDSFTKDEIISAYMRSRVQQITGVTNNLQRRSGSMLPPPADDYCNNSADMKLIPKVVSNIHVFDNISIDVLINQDTRSIRKSSPPNGSTGRSFTLPAGASWGMRSSGQPSVPDPACSNEPLATPGTFLSAVANRAQTPVSHSDVLKKADSGKNCLTLLGNTKSELSNPLRQQIPLDSRTNLPEKPSSPDRSWSNKGAAFVSASLDDNRVASTPSKSSDSISQSCRSMPSGKTEVDGRIQSLCSYSAMTVDEHVMNNHNGVTRSNSWHCDFASVKSPGMAVLEQQCAEENSEDLTKSVVLENEECVSREESDERADPVSQSVTETDPEIEDDISLFNRQRLMDLEVVSFPFDHMPAHLSQYNGELGAPNTIFDPSFDHRDEALHISHGYTEKPCGGSNLLPGSLDHPIQYPLLNGSLDHSILFPDRAREIKPIGKSLTGSQGKATTSMREDNIIADILSLDLDEPLTSPHNLAKLLKETDKEALPLKLSKSCKVQNNESRFSFARQEESRDQAFQYNGIFNQTSCDNGFHRDSADSHDPYNDRLGMYNSISSSGLKGFFNLTGTPAFSSFNKLPTVSRSPVSAPPGFTAPSRAPPPGFSSNGRAEHTFDGNRFLESTLLRNLYQAPQVKNIGGVGDIELMDPAILAVGQGRIQAGFENARIDLRSNFQGNMSTFENEAKLRQMLIGNPLSSHQNLRFSGFGDDSRAVVHSNVMSSRLMDQSQGSSVSSPYAQLSLQQASRNVLLPNGHWDRWSNDNMQGGSRVSVADHLRNERLGFNKLYGNCEGAAAFEMPSSGDMYNGKYGI